MWHGGVIDVYNTSDCSGEPVSPRTHVDGCESAIPAQWFPSAASSNAEAHLTMHCDATSGYARVCGAQVPDGEARNQPLLCPVLELVVVVLPRCHRS